MKDNASRTRTAALAAALLLTTALGPAGGVAQTADFTIQTAIAAILEWGSQAKDFSEYRWQTTRDQLADSLVGSTISIGALPIAANRIQVRDGRAYWATRASLADGTCPDGIIDISIPAESRSNISGTTRYGVGRVSVVDLAIFDVSDRLAMEIMGKTQIDVIGRIRELKVDVFGGTVVLTVDVTSWSKRGSMAEPSHVSGRRSDIRSMLASGRFDEAAQAIGALQRLVPDDQELRQWSDDITIVSRWSVMHDHGVEGFVGSLLGDKLGCQGTLILRKAYLEFRGQDHQALWNVQQLKEIKSRFPLKGISISDYSGQKFRFLIDENTSAAIVEAVERVRSMR